MAGMRMWDNPDSELIKKLVTDVQSTFNRLTTALKSRELQLLRQVDVILQQYASQQNQTKRFDRVKVSFDNEIDILKTITNFGSIDFEGVALNTNIYKIEDYENPTLDHVCLRKFLKIGFEYPERDAPVVADETTLNESQILREIDYIDRSSDDKLARYLGQAKDLCSFEFGSDNGESHVEACENEFKPLLSSSLDENCVVVGMKFIDDDETIGNINSSSSSYQTNSTNFDSSSRETNPSDHTDDQNPIDQTRMTSESHETNECACSPKWNSSVNNFTMLLRQISAEHPKQVHDWVQQLLGESECEPINSDDLLEHINITG